MMLLITKAVGQTYIKIAANIKISTKVIPSFEVIVVSREVQDKFEKGEVIIAEVSSVVLQKSAVEILGVRKTYIRSMHWYFILEGLNDK